MLHKMIIKLHKLLLKESKRINVFISHAWEYHSEYIELMELIYMYDDLKCSINSSLLIQDYYDDLNIKELDFKKDFLPNLLQKQISASDCLLVIPELYKKYKFWIQMQIDIADKHYLPIIIINSFNLHSLPAELTNEKYEIIPHDYEFVKKTLLNKAMK